MRKRKRQDLDRGLEAYFSTLRTQHITDALKRSVGRWQLYAAVSSSALAMSTGAAAALFTDGVPISPDLAASVRAAEPARRKGPRFLDDARFVVAWQRRKVSMGESPRADAVAPTQAPSIAAGGVVPVFGTSSIIQAGELVSITGENLAPGVASWNGDFPTSLGSTNVTIDGKAAYLLYVSPTLIYLQAPDDAKLGEVMVVVNTATGSASSTATLSRFAPSFTLAEQNYVTGIILRSDRSGAFGGGSYDILGPAGNAFGYKTVAARAGDKVEIFGVGFGPTTPDVAAGRAFSGTAPANNPVSVWINNVLVATTSVGLSSAGLYTISLTVPPCLGDGAVPLQASVGGVQTQSGVLFPLQSGSLASCTNTATNGTSAGDIGIVTPPPGGSVVTPPSGSTAAPPGGTNGGMGGDTGGGSGGGTAGGSGGGSGGGSAALRAPYRPRLRFDSKEEST